MKSQSPYRTVTVFLILIAFSAVFLNYWEYSRVFYSNPDAWQKMLDGRADAPEQYRVALMKLAQFLVVHTSIAMRHAIALIDLIALLLAGFLLRAALFGSTTWQSASLASKWFGAAAFLGLLLYFLSWLTWYQRPETLSTAALLVLSLTVTAHRVPVGGAAGSSLTALILIALGLAFGFVRPDVGFTFNLATAILCIMPFGNGFALPRWNQCIASLMAAAASAGAQLYLMFVVYPHATYGDTPAFQLLLNATSAYRLVPFVLYLPPVVWGAMQVLRRHYRPSSPQAATLLGAILFLPLWCVAGKVDEVRIFLPYAFALTPMIVEAAMVRIKKFSEAATINA